MRKLLLLLALVSNVALAQFGISAGPSPTHADPNRIMPAGKIYIDTATIPGIRLGSSTRDIDIICTGSLAGCSPFSVDPTAGTPPVAGGAFRMNCGPSHYSFDDPIVWPGQPGKTHLHEFFGNDTTKGTSDLKNQANVGTSTCDGGIANRTGYWVPPLVYHCPNPAISGCDGTRNGHVYLAQSVGNGANLVYYKSGEPSTFPDETGITWPPATMVMIAGDAAATSLQLDGHKSWGCYDDPGGLTKQGRIPNTSEATGAASCAELVMSVFFPQCLNDSLATDSPDHKSHLVYITGNSVAHPGYAACDTVGFSVVIPSISVNVHYRPGSLADYDYLRVSSDPAENTGVTQTSADASHIKLASSETADYTLGMLFIAGVGRQITAWDGTTKIATVGSAFSGTPALGTTYAVRQPGGITMHADWANGWDQSTVVVNGKVVTQIILDKCLKVLVNCGTDALGDPDPTADHTSAPSATKWHYMRARPQ